MWGWNKGQNTEGQRNEKKNQQNKILGWRGAETKKSWHGREKQTNAELKSDCEGFFYPLDNRRNKKEILARVREYARDALRNMECLNYKESQLSSYCN